MLPSQGKQDPGPVSQKRQMGEGGGGLDPGFFPDLGFFSTSVVNRGSLAPGWGGRKH